MPDPTLSDAWKEAAASCLHNVALIDTIELSHPGLDAPVRLAKVLDDTIDLGIPEEVEPVTFRACAFELALPASGQDGSQDLQFSIANVTREIGQVIRQCLSIAAPVQLTQRIYRSDDLTQPQNGTGLVLFLYDVIVNSKQVSGRASFTEIINRKWPVGDSYYSKSRFPALQT